jgi:hypothetical protein
MKIAITCGDLVFTTDNRIFTNGHHLNLLLWYRFFEKCGYNALFVSNTMETNIITTDCFTYNIINYNSWFENEKELQKKNIDFLFVAGLTDHKLCNLFNKCNIKIISSIMGNEYICDIDNIIYDKPYCTSLHRDPYDEIWISPHFAYSLEYYKIRYRTNNIQIAPYIWADDIIKNKTVLEYKPNTNLIVAICEPNLSHIKNCVIPLCICEKGSKYIDFVRCYGTNKLRDNSLFIHLANNLTLTKQKKIVFNNRDAIVDILGKCNCVISTTQECDLNYMYFECFYFGIPLIHNSKMLQEYGYYYPDLDIIKAAEQIEKVFYTHDTKLYIEKHKLLLQKHSINNKYYKEWVNKRLISMSENSIKTL